MSRLHGEVSSAMWRHLFPEGAANPVGYVTNGVHTASWVGPEMRTFYQQHVDPDWEAHLLEPAVWSKVKRAPDAALWAAHRAQKERLVRFVRERVRVQSARHGLSPDELRQVEGLLDPHALTIGFARRFATYKRAFLIMSDLDRLRAIVGDAQRPVQFLFAGKAHPADREGQEVVRRLFALTHGEFRGHLVFLEDYDIEVGRALVQGCDVWLNTPRRPQEASGTSGQKVPINGGVNLSILDGWWAEGYRGDNGWAIGDSSHRARHRRPGPRRRRVALPPARDRGGPALLRPRRRRPPARVAPDHEGLDRVGGRPLQRPPHGPRLRGRQLPARPAGRPRQGLIRLDLASSGVDHGLVEALALGQGRADQVLAAGGVVGVDHQVGLGRPGLGAVGGAEVLADQDHEQAPARVGREPQQALGQRLGLARLGRGARGDRHLVDALLDEARAFLDVVDGVHVVARG